MKYYVKNGTIFNLENADESFTEISEVEAMRLIKPSEFHEWSGTEWLDPRTEEEKLAYKRSQYPKLTRYQFMRGMLEYGYEAEDIESKSKNIVFTATFLDSEGNYLTDGTKVSFNIGGVIYNSQISGNKGLASID